PPRRRRGRLPVSAMAPVARVSGVHPRDPVAHRARLRQLRRLAPGHPVSRRSSHLVSSPEAIAVAGPSLDGEARVEIRVPRGPVDRAYRLMARLAASATRALVPLIGAFIPARAIPALRAAGWGLLT